MLCDLGEVASLHRWLGLAWGSWRSSETAQSGLCDQFYGRFCPKSSRSYAMLHDGQRAPSIGYSRSTPEVAACPRTLHGQPSPPSSSQLLGTWPLSVWPALMLSQLSRGGGLWGGTCSLVHTWASHSLLVPQLPTTSHGEDRPCCCLDTASWSDLTKMGLHHLSRGEGPAWLRSLSFQGNNYV